MDEIDSAIVNCLQGGFPLVERPFAEVAAELGLAEENLIAQNALIGAARALYFPTISLTGAYGRASQELHRLFKDPSRAWNFTGTVQGPLFTFGAIYGQVKQANASQMAALQAYEATVQNAFADVENALSSREKLGQELAAQTRLVAA